MYLTDEKIIKMLKDYIDDELMQQAILINGEWGSGKTFFVKEKLLKNLRGEYSQWHIFYVSLYGMDNLSQIMISIYNAMVEEFLDKSVGSEKREIVKKGANFIAKLCSAGLKYFNLDTKDLPTIDDIKEIQDSIIIFDDLERCGIDINQILGFLNELVEHNNIKAIIVANEDEIGSLGMLNDLPQKYSLALDTRLNLNISNEEGNNSKNIDSKFINKEELISRTNQIFSSDILYNRIKEKVIGLTINYQAKLEDIYESIIGTYIKEENLKEQFYKKRKVVIGIFNKKQHYNIRTLIFGLKAYEKILKVIDKNKIQVDNYLEKYKDLILKYTMELSIQIKSGKPTYSWSNNTAKVGMVHWNNILSENGIYGFKFIDIYLLYGYLDEEEVVSILRELIKQDKEYDEYSRENDNLELIKISRWWEMEDEEIEESLPKLEEELKQGKYRLGDFKEIIYRLLQMEYANFDEIDYSKYVALMVKRVESGDFSSERRWLEILSDDKDFLSRYNDIMEPVFEVIEKQDREKKEDRDQFLLSTKEWDNEFISKCGNNKESYLLERKFFSYMNPANVIEMLKSSKVKEIYNFIYAIRSVYSFSNLNDYFKGDLDNINYLIENINLEELSQGKHTKEKAIKHLCAYLKEVAELIDR